MSEKTLTNPIRYYRKKKGLTMQQLADSVQTPLRTIQKYELGEAKVENMTASLYLRIADALDVDPHDLIR